MRLSYLSAYLEGTVSTESFLAEIAAELSEYSYGLQERGRSCPIVVSQDIDMTIDSKAVVSLCSKVIDGSLNTVQLDYITTALELAERVEFESDEIYEYIFEMSAPEANGAFTEQRAAEISRALIV